MFYSIHFVLDSAIEISDCYGSESQSSVWLGLFLDPHIKEFKQIKMWAANYL